MNNFLRNLTATQQVGALFLVMFGILSAVTVWAFVRNLREHASDDPGSEARVLEARRFWGLLKTSWMMASVFWMAGAGRHGNHCAVRHRGLFLRCASSSRSRPPAWRHRYLVLASSYCCRCISGSWAQQL